MRPVGCQGPSFNEVKNATDARTDVIGTRVDRERRKRYARRAEPGDDSVARARTGPRIVPRGSVDLGDNMADDGSDTYTGDPQNLLSSIVKRIRSEPLLFAIAIVLLLGGFAVKATELGNNLSLFVFAITGFAGLALIGYYVVAALHEVQVRGRADASSGSTSYSVTTANSSGPLAVGPNSRASQNITSGQSPTKPRVARSLKDDATTRS